jgi:hypothetical protein
MTLIFLMVNLMKFKYGSSISDEKLSIQIETGHLCKPHNGFQRLDMKTKEYKLPYKRI